MLLIYTLSKSNHLYIAEPIIIMNTTTTASKTIDDAIEEDAEEKETIIATPLAAEEVIEYSSKEYDDRLKILYDPKFTLEDRIKIFLGSDIENIGFVYYNLDSNENIKINSDTIFNAASVYKVGLNMYTYYLVNNELASLDDIVYYSESDFEDGSGILQDEGYIGGRTVQELLDLSIMYSDNIASNMLWRYAGGYYNFKYGLYALIGLQCDVKENVLTPEMDFRILKYIYDNKDNPNFAHVISTMENTIFHDRIDKYLPKEIVAHKIGDYDACSHDASIVFADSPYILIIFTDCVEGSYEKMAQVSKAIYEYNTIKN